MKKYSTKLYKNLRPLFNDGADVYISVTVHHTFETSGTVVRIRPTKSNLSISMRNEGVCLCLSLNSADYSEVERTLKNYYLRRIWGNYNSGFNFYSCPVKQFINKKYLTLWELEQ